MLGFIAGIDRANGLIDEKIVSLSTYRKQKNGYTGLP